MSNMQLPCVSRKMALWPPRLIAASKICSKPSLQRTKRQRRPPAPHRRRANTPFAFTTNAELCASFAVVGQYVNTDYRDLGANSAGEVPGANTASKKVGAKFVAGRAFASMAGCAADALIAKLQMREADVLRPKKLLSTISEAAQEFCHERLG